MSETRFPPPSSGHAPLSGAGSERPIAQNIPVLYVPAGIKADSGKTLLLAGHITASQPAPGTTTIRTQAGDMTLQSPGTLPVGAQVNIELRQQSQTLRAAVYLLQSRPADTSPLRGTAPHPASTQGAAAPAADNIKSGDRVTALRLPQDAPPPPPPAQTQPPASAPAPLPTLAQTAQIIEALRASIGTAGLPSALPALPPVPLPVLWQIVNARDVLAMLLRLPETVQMQIQSFIAAPDVAQAIRGALPPLQAQTLLPPAPDAAAAQDLAQAQMALRPEIPVPLANTAQTAPPAAGAMAGLLPLIENMLSPAPALQSLMAGKLPQMTAHAAGLPLPQNMVQLTVHDILPPSAAGQAAPAAGQLLATVESLTASGAPVLRAGDAYFVLQRAANLPIGTQMILSLAPLSPDDILALAPRAAQTGLALDPLFSRSWNTLEETLAALGSLSAQAAQALLQSIPAAGARLPPATLFFLAALRMGQIESWLGESVLQPLRGNGRKDLADRLAQDFTRLADQSKTLIAGEWRAISIPLQHETHISMMQFFIRQHVQDKADDDADAHSTDKKTRFILNLQLSRMGDMQLDGLVQKKRFDLILRTEERLSADIRQELLQRFTAGIEQTGMDGSMRFQTRAEHWTVITADIDTDWQA